MADQSILAMIQAAAAKYGVDPSLAAAVAQQESGVRQTNSAGSPIVSSAGAIGVYQLEPATAAGLGVNPYDAAQNVDGGVRYLSQLLSQFGGDVSLALAAYNAGPGNVRKYDGIPPFAETQNYVSSIMAAIGLAPPDPPTAPRPRRTGGPTSPSSRTRVNG